MGHAGAIVTRGVGGAAAKIRALEEAGIRVVRTPSEVGITVKEVLDAR
jgi:succinyl-CoA synthetase alpha subunit